MIWFKRFALEEINKSSKNTMLEHLDIKITEIGDDYLVGSMPVDSRTKQPFGILHGGANCVLAESLGSLAANLTLDSSKEHAVGFNINTTHLKAVRQGHVMGRAVRVHGGKTTQLWNIKTFNDSGALTSETQLSLMILERKF